MKLGIALQVSSLSPSFSFSFIAAIALSEIRVVLSSSRGREALFKVHVASPLLRVAVHDGSHTMPLIGRRLSATPSRASCMPRQGGHLHRGGDVTRRRAPMLDDVPRSRRLARGHGPILHEVVR